MGTSISTMGFGSSKEAAIDSLRCALLFAGYNVDKSMTSSPDKDIPEADIFMKIHEYGTFKVNFTHVRKVYATSLTYHSSC